MRAGRSPWNSASVAESAKDAITGRSDYTAFPVSMQANPLCGRGSACGSALSGVSKSLSKRPLETRTRPWDLANEPALQPREPEGAKRAMALVNCKRLLASPTAGPPIDWLSALMKDRKNGSEVGVADEIDAVRKFPKNSALNCVDDNWD